MTAMIYLRKVVLLSAVLLYASIRYADNESASCRHLNGIWKTVFSPEDETQEIVDDLPFFSRGGYFVKITAKKGEFSITYMNGADRYRVRFGECKRLGQTFVVKTTVENRTKTYQIQLRHATKICFDSKLSHSASSLSNHQPDCFVRLTMNEMETLRMEEVFSEY